MIREEPDAETIFDKSNAAGQTNFLASGAGRFVARGL
jgi:hypothetical protein